MKCEQDMNAYVVRCTINPILYQLLFDTPHINPMFS